MFPDAFDRTIRRTLKQLAGQRVRLVLQPGNYWVIENTGAETEDTHAALATCYMRGWIEPLPNAVPSAQVPDDFDLSRVKLDQIKQQYRHTSAGWSALYRTAEIARIAFAVSLVPLAIVIARLSMGI